MNEMYQMAVLKDLCWDSVMIGFLSDGRIGNSHTDVPGHDGSLGYGGKCLPKDSEGLLKVAEKHGIVMETLHAAVASNKKRRENDK